MSNPITFMFVLALLYAFKRAVDVVFVWATTNPPQSASPIERTVTFRYEYEWSPKQSPTAHQAPSTKGAQVRIGDKIRYYAPDYRFDVITAKVTRINNVHGEQFIDLEYHDQSFGNCSALNVRRGLFPGGWMPIPG